MDVTRQSDYSSLEEILKKYSAENFVTKAVGNTTLKKEKENNIINTITENENNSNFGNATSPTNRHQQQSTTTNHFVKIKAVDASLFKNEQQQFLLEIVNEVVIKNRTPLVLQNIMDLSQFTLANLSAYMQEKGRQT